MNEVIAESDVEDHMQHPWLLSVLDLLYIPENASQNE